MVRHHAYSTQWGAVMVAPSRARFRIWAPSAPQVMLEIEGADPIPLALEPDGWHEVTADATPGMCYGYRVAPDLVVPDPASRFQPHDVHGLSQLVDPDAFAWRDDGWIGRPWEETVLYEVHVGAAGGYRSLMADLPRLRDLGITAIELMPLSEFPGGRNWGYDGVLPYAPESAYGTTDDLKTLIDAAHRLGLMVFLDVVYNHFGPDGNFLASYAKPFFHDGEPTPWGDAIDFGQTAVRQFFTDNALYWLMEYRIDGLRLDAVQAINHRDWLPEMAAAVRATVEPGRYVHLVLENENNDAALLREGFTAQWNDDSHNVLHVMLTGEDESYYAGFSDNSAQGLARVLSEGFLYQGEHFAPRGHARGMPSADLPPTAFVMFLQNHDQIGNRALGERLSTLADPHALKAAYALLLLSPQIPMLFMGEEWGSRCPFLFFTSHNAELGAIVREGRRKEFADFSHFSDPARRETIPDPNAESTFLASVPTAAERDLADHRAWIATTTTLLTLRRTHIVPRLAGARSLGARALGSSAVLAGWRLGDGARLSIAVNLGEDVPRDTVTLPGTPLFAYPPGCAALSGRSIVVTLVGADDA
ncbi:malto-oligosyltrehalose trehalohydrolase [Ameyamaea chiangmaiensis NBRC 103196]|uniref:Malto-oligosyltrehalose trehalohydrolase n=1 Tax=Ameyamaea chiangmaiensis TaxID=442969 RepID=A0A850PDQ2_9PROT|nr:malto-oligosyltrehalose trehalohydrolase [Ameyamaea chiangmaiensis]MBS4074691.1 malto-oligosyltrehalose trehalohydrolase [Ameyamaea chiangmaiensis]NVN40406.1 malto-oligosyltrehalose trehalohydrolase [Ameyamaea chiangmaiensis]GBQ62379.1 malto-oligosyltrehalose trehalohydrolase [Ameyamaea chiangmaiensis NBRC 103196]